LDDPEPMMTYRACVKTSSRRQPWADLALPALVGLFTVVGSFGAADNQPDREALDGVAVALLLTGPMALVFRRRYPVPVLGVTLVATLAYIALGYPYGPLFASLAIAFFTTVTQGRRLAAWAFAGAGYLAYLSMGVVVTSEDRPTLAHATGVAAWLLVVLVVAEVARVRGERAAEAEHARQEEVRRRASEERLGIARELHDVLAHNISLINVQAGVALHLMDERPEQARTALVTIKEASGEALREVRSVLGMLRQVDESAPRDPAPGLARIDGLVSRAEAAGLRVRVEVEGAPRPLPAGLDLAAFRIAQEALTNVARHADATTTTVRLTYGRGELTLQVDDDGRGGAAPSTMGTGSGITGMRERAVALGGQLEAGPRADGGFRVRARLPLAEAP
jgi:signal transduction histidine kinase